MNHDYNCASAQSELTKGQAKAAPIVQTGFNNILDENEQRLGFLVETMRRVENLLDRLQGATASDEPAMKDTRPDYPNGYIGALLRQQDDAYVATSRIASAMEKIEKIL